MPGPEHVAGRCARLPASVYPVSQDCGGIEDWTVVRAAMYAAAPCAQHEASPWVNTRTRAKGGLSRYHTSLIHIFCVMKWKSLF